MPMVWRVMPAGSFSPPLVTHPPALGGSRYRATGLRFLLLLGMGLAAKNTPSPGTSNVGNSGQNP